MSSLPLHPMIVHIPIVLALAVPIIALLVLLGRYFDKLGRRAWIGFAVLQVLLAGSAFAAMQFGEQDEEIAEEVVSHHAIEEHEEAGERMAWTAGIVALLGVGGLLVPVPIVRKSLLSVAVVGSFVTAGMGVAAGHTGGELVYKHGAAQAHVERIKSDPLAVNMSDGERTDSSKRSKSSKDKAERTKSSSAKDDDERTNSSEDTKTATETATRT